MLFRCFWLIFSLIAAHCVAAQTNFKRDLKAYRITYQQTLFGNESAPLDSLSIQGLRFFRPKKKYRVEATFTRLPDARPFEMPTYDGEVQPFVAYGKVDFALHGDSLQLTVYRNLRMIRVPLFRDQLFLPFKDLSNSKSTYGGGRYLDLKISDLQNGKLKIDFNKAYNPYCAYSEGYTCPIPPFENHLLVKVKAGEKDYKP